MGSWQSTVLQQIRKESKYYLKFNKDKMRLHLTRLLHIGHHVSAQGVWPYLAKVTAVKNMSVPSSLSDVKCFIKY